MLLFPLPLYGNLFGRFLLLFIGKNKCKIKERTTEHKRDVHLNKETTALAKLNRKENIEIDFTHIEKLSNFENHNYSFKEKISKSLLKNSATTLWSMRSCINPESHLSCSEERL